MEILVIGDPHFKNNNAEDSEEMSRQIVAIAKERQPDLIVVLGDTLHTHETSFEAPYRRATQFLERLTEISEVYLLIGNHDRPSNKDFLSDRHHFQPLRSWKNMVVVERVEVHDTPQGRLVFVPYVTTGRFQEALETRPEIFSDGKVEARIVFAHQEFRGALLGKQGVSTAGDPWPVEWPLVLSGHIHGYSCPQENLVYVGTPMAHSFDETDEKAIEWVTVSETDIHRERIPLDLPRKITITCHVKELDKKIPKVSRDHLRVIVSGTTLEIREHRLHLERLRERGVKVVERPEITYSDGEAFQPKKIERKGYAQTLFEECQVDARLVHLFTKLFPKPT